MLENACARAQVPISMILCGGVEDLAAQPDEASARAALSPAADPAVKRSTSRRRPPRTARSRLRSALRLILFLAGFCGAAAALALLSDLSLRAFAEHPCMGWLPDLPSAARTARESALRMLQPFDASLDTAAASLGALSPAADRMQATLNSMRQVRQECAVTTSRRRKNRLGGAGRRRGGGRRAVCA